MLQVATAEAAKASLTEFYARNARADLSHPNLLDPDHVDALNWDGSERDRLLGPLRVVARLTPNPQHAAALVDAGFGSAHRVAHLRPADFVVRMRDKIDPGAARTIHDRARGVRARVLQRWMQLREAASPYRRVLSAHERRANLVTQTSTAVAPGVAVNYKSIFGEAADSDIPHDASIIGPGAYMADLMATVDRTITTQSPDLPDALKLSNRRPDLQNLLLTPANATDEIPTVELILEVLESSLEAFARNRTTMTPGYPANQPASVRVVPAWPTSVQGGTLYTVVGSSLTIASSTTLSGTVTIRSGPGLQSVSAPAPIAIGSPGGSGDTSVVIEGFAFSLDPANTTAIVQFNGGSLVLRNCIFSLPAGATASAGWAITCADGASGSVLIENCTFVDNSNTPSVPSIAATNTGALTLSASDSIVWPGPDTTPKGGYGFIACGTTNAVNVAACDIKGGKASITGAPRINYADTNFDEDPQFVLKTAPPSSVFNPASPCIGRGSQGRNVGASFDIYDALAWAVYPPDLPFDRQFATAQMALAALDIDLGEVDRALAPLVSATDGQNVYFPLSQLDISLADYQVLTTKITAAKALAPYFGLPDSDLAFAGAAVRFMPSSPAWTFAATDVATWLRLTPDGLRDLVYEDLAAAEIAQGIQSGNVPEVSGWNGFFVNGQGDAACNTLALVTQYVPVGRSALTFDGKTTSINAGALPLPTTMASLDAFTISVWLYQPIEPSSAATILAIGAAMVWQITDFTLTIELTARRTTATVTADLSAFTIDPQWMHVAATFDPLAATFSVYVNGTPAASLALPNAGNVKGAVMLGGNRFGVDRFSGLLCELAIWDFASTAEQITTMFQTQPMTAPKTTPPAGLLLYLPVNDGTGDAVTEWVSGNPCPIATTSPSWIPVGLPSQVANLEPGTSAVKDGVIFAQTELLVGRGANAGVTVANLDRINRFTRLARRTGWSFAELDWALFTLFPVDSVAAPTDFAGAPRLFADLARVSDAAARMNVGVREACALFGPLKPFGRGRLGDQVALFDQVFNRPPLSGAALAPDMSLTLSVTSDFEKPGPIARRLASLLNLDVGQLTSLVRSLASADAFVLNGTSLTALYRYRLLAGWLGLAVDAFLDLVWLTKLSATGATCSPADFSAFMRTVDWIGQAGLKPPDLRYVITPRGTSADPYQPADPYQKKVELEITDKLSKLKSDLSQAATPWLVGQDSFISPNATEAQSLAVYNDALTKNYIDASGIITSTLWARLPQAPYRVPSDAYKTIADAVTAAVAALNAGVPAATVLIAPGTYDQDGGYGVTIALSQGVLTLQAQADFSTTIIDCKQNGNFLTVNAADGGNAGGLVVVNGLTIQNGSVSSGAGGGAIYSACALELANCILRGNTAQNGGAIYLAGSSAPLRFSAANCVFYGNVASKNGGALYLNEAASTLSFCTAYGNRSGDGTSNGVYVNGDANSALTVSQSILWNLTPKFTDHDDWNGNVTPTFEYSDVHQTSWKINAYPIGCISADPQLLDASNGVYELTPPTPGKSGTGSPCWNAAEGGGNMGFGGATEADLTALALYPFAYAQIGALQKALSRLFDNDVLPFDVVLGALGPYTNGLQILLSDTTDTPTAIAYVRDVFRYLLLANLFGLDGRMLTLIFSDPTLFSLAGSGTPPVPTLGDLELLARFARLRTQYPAAIDGLIGDLRRSRGTAGTDAAATLATLFGWDTGDIAALLEAAVPETVAFATIIAAADAMALVQRSGLDAPALLSLYRNGLVQGAEGATPLLEAVAAADPDEAAAVTAAVADLRRDALKAFAVPQINAATSGAGFPVVTDNDLSDYLLLDVDMGVETSTSRIVQATLSLQQYIQRCRLALEPGAGPPDLTDREWEWLRSYRMWEANRKVFLYPETYLRPELRNNKTPLFAEFEEGLSNSVMTKEGLERLYRRYLDHFAVVASLQTVGSWFEPGRAIDSVMTATSGAMPAYVTATCNSSSNSFSAMTVEAWICINRAKPAQPNLLLGAYHGKELTLGFTVDQDGRLNVTAGSSASAQTNTALQADTWYHVAAVLDSAAQSISLFVDGMPAGGSINQTIGSFAFSAGDIVNLGQDTSAAKPAAHVGCANALAEVRIWTVARIQPRIQGDMRRRIPASSPAFKGLIGYWTFEDGSIADQTGTWGNPTINPAVNLTVIPAINGSVSFGPMTPPLDPQAQPDLYYFIGKTRTQPPTFYCRSMEMRTAQTPLWNAWEKIDLSINANYATPVVSEGRLYLFWVEFQEVQANKNVKPIPVPHHYRATIKYSMRNADGSWLAAQSPFPKIELPSDLDPYSNPIWQKPVAFPTANSGASAIVVIYGVTDNASVPATITYCGILNWDQTVVASWNPLGSASLSLDQTWDYSTLASGAAGYPGAWPPGLWWLTGQDVRSTIGLLRPSFGILGCDDQGTIYSCQGPSLQPFPTPGGGWGVLGWHQGRLFAAASIQVGNQNYNTSLYENSAPLRPKGNWTMVNPALLPNSALAYPFQLSVVAANGNLYFGFWAFPGPFYGCANQSFENLGTTWQEDTLSLNSKWNGQGGGITLGPDGILYYVFTFGGPPQYCTNPGGNPWSSPSPLSGLPAGPNYSVSNAIFWNGQWYLAVSQQSILPISIFRATSIGASWSSVKSGPSAKGASGLFLVACPEGVYLYTFSSPTGLFFTSDPSSGSWTSINIGATAFRNIIRNDVHPHLLTSPLPDGATTAPVMNQLGAGTLSMAGADFLVQALDPTTGGVMNGQLQVTMLAGNQLSLHAPLTPPDVLDAHFRLRRLSSSAVQTLARELATGGIDALLSQASQQAAEFSIADMINQEITKGPDQDTISFALSDPYGMYYREIFFFIPWLIAQRLQSNGQFADARTYLEYIFKPSAAANDVGSNDNDYWQCLWLRGAETIGTLDALEDLDPAALAAYHDDPFDATAIADLRLSAYQRAIVTAYIQNLIAWGDSLFTANTRETINEADQLYRYARDILGPRPRRRPYAPPAPQTFADFVHERENEFLMVIEALDAQSGTDAPIPPREGTDPSDGVMDNGFYFGVPDSSEFLANWDTLDDRLHKIRHGLDITGKVDDLALFDPPLSVGDIQRLGRSGGTAAATGDDAARILLLENQFLTMLYSSRTLAGSVVDYGRSLLQALEAQDADGLYLLQSSQQGALADRMRQIRTNDVNNAKATVSALEAVLSSAKYRRDYYKGLLATGESKGETEAIALSGTSLDFRWASTLANQISAPLWLVPNIYGVATGGMSPGGSAQAVAQVFGDISANMSERAGIATTLASYDRRKQDWEFQQKLAEFDVDQVTKQVTAAQAQADSVQKQFDLEQASFEQAQAVQQYYVDKFSNGQLYGWMADTLATLYQQLYQIAFSSAQTLQATLTTLTGVEQQFLNPSGWDAGWRGLLAGESLLVDVARMEQAFNQWQRAHPIEPAQKPVSLRQHAPDAFRALVTTGKCAFDLDHASFDRDFPGHYLRTLSGLSVQLPGLAAQRHDLRMVATRLWHDTLRRPDASTARFLLGQPGASPGKALHRVLQPRRAALSHVPCVDGREQGEFHSGPIHAFDGGGAVSRWQLEIPLAQNRVDLAAIRDVVLTVHYHARYGGDDFRRDVEAALPDLRTGILIDVASDFAAQWDGRTRAGDWELALPVARNLLPRNLPGRVFRPARVSVTVVPEDGGDLTDAALSLGLPGARAPYRLTLQSSESVPRVLSVEATPAERLWGEPWSLSFAANAQAEGVKNVHLFVEFDEIAGA